MISVKPYDRVYYHYDCLFQLHTLAASWCLLTPVLAPVVAFEIALAVYVEGERDNLTAAEVFTPLVVWCW